MAHRLTFYVPAALRALGLSTMLLTPVAALAQPSAVSDTVTITSEFLVTPLSLTVLESDETNPPVFATVGTVTYPDGFFTSLTPAAVVLVEPAGAPNAGQASDILWMEILSPAALRFSFVSSEDPAALESLITGLPLGTTIARIPETGADQDITGNLGLLTGCIRGSCATAVTVFSAVPNTPPVPEPSTWLLLGSGLAGLAAWRNRHRV